MNIDLEMLNGTWIGLIVVCAFVFLLATFLGRVIGRGFDLLSSRTKTSRLSLRPFERVAKLFLLIGAGVIVLQLFGYNLSGVWTVLSTLMAMVAIGFIAVWSVLSNLSASALILFSGAVKVGDSIEISGETLTGKVTDIGLLFFTAEAEDGTRWRIPNNLVFQRVIRIAA